jgi:PilS N terminal.
MTPHRRPLPAAVSEALPDQQGFGLLSLIVVLALSTAVVGVAYTVYRQDAIASDASAAASSAAALGQVVRTAYASSPTFDLLTNARMTQERLWPKNVLDRIGQPVNPWGGSIQLAGASGDGFALTYEGVASAACPRFVSAAATGWDDVTVNGHSVLSGRKVQPAAAALLCSQAATDTVQFLGSKGTGAATLPTLNACVPPAPQTQTIAVAGELSDVPPYPAACLNQQRDAFCANPYSLPAWGPWTNTTSTCAPVCVAPPPTLTTQTQTVPGSAACPGGQTGSDTWTQSQTRTQSVAHTCSTPVGPVVDQPATYSPWVNSGGHIGEVNTCAPTCATRLGTAPWLPNPATQTRMTPGSAACPSGVGTDTWQQKQISTRTATCAAPGAAVDPTWGAWSAWTNTGGKVGEVNNCAPPCGPAPAPQTRTASCPAGQTGSITQSEGWTSKPAPTCWAASGTWTTVSSSCVTPPPACPAATFVPVRIGYGVNGNNGGGWPGIWSVGNVATTIGGPSSGFFTVQVTYHGQTVQATATCVGSIAKFGTNDFCQTDNGAFTFTVGGGTFQVGVYSYKPSKGDQGAGPWGAQGSASMISKAPGC